MIKLISTDFDGTLFSEHEAPPVPEELQALIGQLQRGGARWVINTGRDMPALMETLASARLAVRPDYLVLVEREIHFLDGDRYVSLEAWNDGCRRAHDRLFVQVRRDMPRLSSWVSSRYNAMVYEDAYSPFCLTALNDRDAEEIHRFMEEYCREVPHLMVMRNNVYARFCHADYHKGTALAEIARVLGIGVSHIFAAGDHLNDLPMLARCHAGCLVAPANALEVVKDAVRRQDGYVSELAHGHGVADGLKHYLNLELRTSKAEL